jgi:hypothetical protein
MRPSIMDMSPSIAASILLALYGFERHSLDIHGY